MQRHDHSPGMGLDEADRKRLAAALAGAREARVYRRLEALLLVAEGHSIAEAARRCRADRSSVHHWLAQYRAEHEATSLRRASRSAPRPCGADCTKRATAGSGRAMSMSHARLICHRKRSHGHVTA